jgi:hypothetical protein
MANVDELKERHERGDRLAFVDAVIQSDEEEQPLPRWAHRFLADKFKGYLTRRYDDLADALFGPRLDGGRHANPRTEREDRERYEQAYAGVRGAVRAGYHGDDKFERGAQVYAHWQGIQYTATHAFVLIDQVQSKFEREQSRITHGLPPQYRLTDADQLATVASGIVVQQNSRR